MQPNKALQLTARQHASQVALSFSLNADRAPQLKAVVRCFLFGEFGGAGMKVVATFILIAVAVLALFFLLMGALGVSFGVRVGGNLFAEEGFSSLRPAYLILLILAAGGGLYLLWRGRRGPA